MLKAIFIDHMGTLVYDTSEWLTKLLDECVENSNEKDPQKLGEMWYQKHDELVMHYNGKDYKNEYEIDPNKKEITMISKDGNGIYYDKEEVKTSLNKLIKEKLVFSTYNLYNYNIEDNKLILKINGQNILVSDDKIDNIVKIDNEIVYYLSDGTLYKYTFGKQVQKIISNTEWKFNSANQIFIFN